MSSSDFLSMSASSKHALDPARDRVTGSQSVNNDAAYDAPSGRYHSSQRSPAHAPRDHTGSHAQQHQQHQQHQAALHAPAASASRALDREGAPPVVPTRRPSGIALPTYQALAHDPVYMAARTSPIGPPPRSALPALPPGPSASSSSSSRGPPPREALPALPSTSNASGMLAMASESRPVTAVFNGNWEYPSSSSNERRPGGAVNGNQAEASTSSNSQERARHTSTSASRQRRHENSEDFLFNNASPSSASHHQRHGTDLSSTSSPPAGESSQRSGQSRPQESSEGSTERMASKTVLTIALMEAQTAVDLDESDQAEAAIASYSKSVGLLQEVMRRVTENAGTYRQKELDRLAQLKSERLARWRQWRIEQYRQAGVTITAAELEIKDEDIETKEERRDREKREARIAKRERMRVEECAKLRVISIQHDTYAERIRALKEELSHRGIPQPPASAETGTAARTTSAGADARVYNSIQRLGDHGSSSTASHPSDSRSGTPHNPRHAAVRASEASEDSAARAGIGSAMLANSPLSPTFAQTSASTSSPPLQGLRSSAVPFPSSPPTSQSEARMSYTSSSSTSPPTLALPEIHPFSFSPTASANSASSSSRKPPRQNSPPAQNSVLSFSPDSEKADSASFSDQQDSPDPRAPSAKTHRKNASSSASYSKSLPTPEGYATFVDLAAQTAERQPSPKPPNMPLHREQDENDALEGLATPTPDTAFSKAFGGSPPAANGERKAQSSDVGRSRASSRASNALRHMTSSESLASTTTSSSIGGQHWNGATQKMPLPPMPAVPKGQSTSPPLAAESASNRASIVGVSRPLRSASLVGPGAQPTQERSATTSPQRNGAAMLANEKQRASALLINPSTLHGTISQRRKSPNIPDTATFPSTEERSGNTDSLGVPASDHPGMAGLGLTRSASTERGAGNRSSTYKTAGGTSPQAAVSPALPQPFNVAGSLPMRLRALSQPSKRPGMPSFNSDIGQPAPPLPTQAAAAPTMQRADSDPTSAPARSDQPPPTPVMPSTPMSFEYPASLEDSIYAVPGTTADGASGQTVSPTSTQQQGGLPLPRTAPPNNEMSFLEPETPASMVFQQTSQSSSPAKGPQTEYQPPPSDAMRVPFHFMRQVRASILSGAYLTPRLYIPKSLWSQSSMKLVHTETKVRMLDLLLNGLESIERAGDVLLLDGQVKAGNTGSKLDAANRLMRELESFEGMLDGVQSTLAKKLPYVEQPNGKKGGGGSFGAWSSKLSRSMDRMTKGKNLDAPETYVAAIARLCLHAQILDRHLASLHGQSNSSVDSNSISPNSRQSQDHTQARLGNNNNIPSSSITTTAAAAAANGTISSGYNDLPPDRRVYIENRLRKSSDFFSKVICKMLLNDLGIWLDKYSKRAAGWTTD